MLELFTMLKTNRTKLFINNKVKFGTSDLTVTLVYSTEQSVRLDLDCVGLVIIDKPNS